MPAADYIDPRSLLASTSKLLDMQNGLAEPDDRDSPRNQNLLGPEDFIRERIEKDSGGVAKNLLWKATNRGRLIGVDYGAHNQQVHGIMVTSGLASPIEEINPLEISDQASRILRTGEGGMPVAAIPDEARNVQPAQFGFIDPYRGPECFDSATEVLTGQGWKFWDEVLPEDTLASRKDNGRTEFKLPRELTKGPYRGTMYQFESPTVEFFVTPSHKVWWAADANSFRKTKPEQLFRHSGDVWFESQTGELIKIQSGEYTIRTVKFSGTVYCARTEAGFLLVRRGPMSRPHWSGNSEKLGVDVRATIGAFKGDDGKIYSEFRNVRTGEVERVAADAASSKVLAFPGELDSDEPMVRALVQGKLGYAPRESIDYELPHFARMLNSNTNMIPFSSATQGNRLLMAGKMLNQATALKDAEAPLVQSESETPGVSFDSVAGERLGIVRSKQGGVVLQVAKDKIKVKNDDGTTEEHELYDAFPFNRKSVSGDTRITLLRDSRVLRQKIEDYCWRDGDLVQSIDPETYEPAWLPVTAFMKMPCDKRMYRVRYNSGRHVDVTEDHSLITLSDTGVLIPVVPAACTVGRTRSPIADLSRLMPDCTTTVTADMATLAGLYVAEGHIPPTQSNLILIAAKPRVRRNQILRLLSRLSEGREAYENGGNICLTAPKLAGWLRQEFGCGAANKHATPCFAWPKELREAFVAGYMAGDGCLNTDSNGAIQVHAVTTSEQLRADLMDLFSAMGVFTSVVSMPRAHLNDKWRDAYGIRLRTADLGKIPQLFFYPDRETKLRRLLPQSVRASQVDSIPTPTTHAAKMAFYATLPASANIKQTYKGAHLGAVHRRHIAGATGAHGRWAQSSVLWDCIVDISEIPQPEFVYDLSVAKSETFCVNGGLLVHNSFLYNTPLVTPGQRYEPGALLARSNYTNDKGEAALGKNLRIAYLPYKGLNTDDAYVISEEAAKKLSSEHMYTSSASSDDKLEFGLKRFVSQFPSRYAGEQIRKLDEDGIIKPGMTVQKGDPLFVAVGEQRHKGDGQWRQLAKSLRNGLADRSSEWEHEFEGEVTDVHRDKRGNVVVAVKGYAPSQVGDKLAGRYGDKGVIAAIVPQAEMPTDANGVAYDVLQDPETFPTRLNSNQLLEVAMSKLARKQGKPVLVPGASKEDMVERVLQTLQENGLTPEEDILDPVLGHKIPQILTGEKYFMKLHHTSEGKQGARSSEGAYTSDGTPAQGGKEGSKTLSNLGLTAILSHDSRAFLKDSKLIRGQRNDDFWRQYQLGYDPQPPKVPQVLDKFKSYLKGAGINIEERDGKSQLMAMTDKDIDKLSKGEVTEWDTVDVNSGDPKEGGLFDRAITGGVGGRNFAHITLGNKVPNPVMEEPIRKLLGLTQKKFEAVLSGKEEFRGKTGPVAIEHALSSMNVDNELALAQQEIRTRKGAGRDMAVKKLRYLLTAKRVDIHPRDWMLSKLLVVPPLFRPINRMNNGTNLVADANYLYQEAMRSNEVYRDSKKAFGDSGAGDEYLGLYKAVKAVTGLGDPDKPELQQRGVQGLLANALGKHAPKHGTYQRRVVGMQTDLASRGVIIPDPKLTMDQVGLPEEQAWSLYKPFVVRRLVRAGMPAADALKHVEERTDRAREDLVREMDARPVVLTRAPALHKYNMLAHKPVLTTGNAIKINPLVNVGYTADFDGDQQISTVIIFLHSVEKCCIDSRDAQWWATRRITMAARMREQLLCGKSGEFYFVDLADVPHASEFVEQGHIRYHRAIDDTYVIAYDEATKRPVLAKVEGWSEHTGQKVEIVTLASGRQIFTDDDERAIYGFDSAQGEFKRARPSEAAKLLVPRVERISDELFEPITSIPAPAGSKFWERIQLSREFGYLLGALIGDGWVSTTHGDSKQVHLAGTLEPVFNRFKASLLSVFQELPNVGVVTQSPATSDRYGKCSRLTISNTAFGDFLLPLIGKLAAGKHLPPFFASAPIEFQLGLLEGIWDTDGSVAVSHGKVTPQSSASISSNSLRLIRELQHLLRINGVRSRATSAKTPAGRDCWVLISTFADFKKVGLRLEAPNKAAVLATGPVPDMASPAAVKNDKVPLPVDLGNFLRAQFAYASSPAEKAEYTCCGRGIQAGNVTRAAAVKWIARFDGAIEHPQWELFKSFARNTDVTWDIVDTVEKTEQVETGYDLTVPGFETFMNADGVILSNTMSVHIPVTEDAVKDAYSKMLPSKNLLKAATQKVQYLPFQGNLFGLYLASQKPTDKPAATFATEADAVRAYKRGEIKVNDPVVILQKG